MIKKQDSFSLENLIGYTIRVKNVCLGTKLVFLYRVSHPITNNDIQLYSGKEIKIKAKYK